MSTRIATVEQLLEVVRDFIIDIVSKGGYLGIFILMALESACIPIPSEVTMPIAGLVASAGKLSLFWVGMVGALANLAGSWAAYALGRGEGRKLLVRYGRYLLIKPHDIERADRWFERYGDSAVFFSRLLPVVRTFISLPAGVARMPFLRFSILTFLGCLPWSFALTWAGYLLGENWDLILPYFEPISYAIAAGLVIAITLFMMRRIRHRRPQGIDNGPGEETVEQLSERGK